MNNRVSAIGAVHGCSRRVITAALPAVVLAAFVSACTDPKKAQSEKISEILRKDRELSLAAAGKINTADAKSIQILVDNRDDRLGLIHALQGMKMIDGDGLRQVIDFLKAENAYCETLARGIAAYDEAYRVGQSRGGFVAHNGYFDMGDKLVRQARIIRARLSEAEVPLKEFGWEPVWKPRS